MEKLDKDAVANFINYLKIKAVHPNPDYGESVRYLKEQAQGLDLPCRVIEIVKDNPIVIITWYGTDPSLPAVLLNSHMDVVPVFPEFWKYDPFSAHKDEKGDIYARGTQDMKCVGIQHIEAIRRLKAEGKRMLRTIHMSFIPDEEVGGHKGMEKFVNHDEFKKMNVGFALDEGLANPTDAYTVYYGERCAHWIEVTCSGNPGHGSRFVAGDAGTKMRKVINSFMSFRDQQEEKLKSDPSLRLGDVTTTNLTCLSGGVQPNVIPAELKAVFDMRIAPTVDLVKLEETIAQWCKNAGEGVTYKYLQKNTCQVLTPTTKDDPWWKAFSSACEKLGIKIELEVFPAATDSRYLREKGLPAIGFSPMNNTPILLHDHNEFLNENIFLKGIPIFMELIQSLANVHA